MDQRQPDDTPTFGTPPALPTSTPDETSDQTPASEQLADQPADQAPDPTSDRAPDQAPDPTSDQTPDRAAEQMPPPPSPAARLDVPPTGLGPPPSAGDAYAGGYPVAGAPAGEPPAADGPPVPPPIRARRRRRRRWGIAAAVVAVVIVIVVPAVFAAIAAFNAEDDPEVPVATDDPDNGPRRGQGPDPRAPDRGGDPDTDAPQGSDRGEGPRPEPPQQLDPPDLGALDGSDAIYGQLLIDVDAAEGVMMSFQAEIGAVFLGPQLDAEALNAALEDTATAHLDDLRTARSSLQTPVDDPGAETVRAAYVEHIDSWESYMEAVEQNPRVLAGEGVDAGYTVDINTTADAFARTLADTMTDDLDQDVRSYGIGILDRGFRGTSAPTV